MTYTVWMDGQQIGETTFEHHRNARQRAGAFHPTEFGLKVLPSITAMAPALFDFGDMCRRAGLNAANASTVDASRVRATFEGTAEGRRLIAAAKQVERLEVRDPSGRKIAYESIAITDLDWLLRLARQRTPSILEEVDALPAHDPIKFMISVTARSDRALTFFPSSSIVA